jgi:hypothetical protein
LHSINTCRQHCYNPSSGSFYFNQTARITLTLGSSLCEQCLGVIGYVVSAVAFGAITHMGHLVGNAQIAMATFTRMLSLTSHCRNVRNERGLQVLHHQFLRVFNNAHTLPRSHQKYVGLNVICQSTIHAPAHVERMLQSSLALLPHLVTSDQHTSEPDRCTRVGLLSQFCRCLVRLHFYFKLLVLFF